MPETLVQIEQNRLRRRGDWRDPQVEFRKGIDLLQRGGQKPHISGPAQSPRLAALRRGLEAPPDWKRIMLDGMRERLEKYRSFRLFMDICVRCGACADKCHFYLGSGDPKNMPVLRAELMRSVYRRYFTLTGRAVWLAGRRPRAYRRRDQGVVLLLLPVHRVPPLLGLLPLRHRHRRNHHDGPRTAEPDRLQHQLDA